MALDADERERVIEALEGLLDDAGREFFGPTYAKAWSVLAELKDMSFEDAVTSVVGDAGLAAEIADRNRDFLEGAAPRM